MGMGQRLTSGCLLLWMFALLVLLQTIAFQSDALMMSGWL